MAPKKGTGVKDPSAHLSRGPWQDENNVYKMEKIVFVINRFSYL